MRDVEFWLKQNTIDVLTAAYLLAGEPLPDELSHSVNDTSYPPTVTAMIRRIKEQTGAVVRVPTVRNRRLLQSKQGGDLSPTIISQTEFHRLMEEQGSLARPQAPAAKWPWGDHETELLRKLAAAADKFWKRYDPAEASTAPTNAAVVAWLKEEGVAERNAEVMATILRADGLPSGPRK